MSKKTMLFALAVVAMFAIPPVASAQEIHFRNWASFSGSGPAGFITAANEPKIGYTKLTITGSFDAGSSTTGKTSLAFSGATAEFLGIKSNCNTTGDASGIITSSATFHLITTSTSKPGILLTPVTTTIICSFARFELTGKGVIGTITSPACGATSNSMTVKFEATGSTQNHLTYTGNIFDLSAHTEGSDGVTTGASGTAALQGEVTFSSPTAGTLECT